MMDELEKVITNQGGIYTVVRVSNERWLCPDCGWSDRPAEKRSSEWFDRLSRIFLVVTMATESQGLRGLQV